MAKGEARFEGVSKTCAEKQLEPVDGNVRPNRSVRGRELVRTNYGDAAGTPRRLPAEMSKAAGNGIMSELPALCDQLRSTA